MKLLFTIALLLAINANVGNSAISPHSKSEKPVFSRIQSIAYKVDKDLELEIDSIVNAIAPKFEQFFSIDSFSDLENEPSTKKKVSFAESETVHVIPSEPSGIFWIKKKEFVRSFTEKSKLYDKSSTEFKVLDIIAGVIEKSHMIYELIYRFLVRMENFDLYLTQTDVKVDKETKVKYPDPEIFDKLEKDKEYLQAKFNDLLILLQPSYKVNEHLFKLMNVMNKNTKIDLSLFEKIKEEAVIMNGVVQKVTYLIKNCSLIKYKKLMSGIRKRTNDLEFKKIDLDAANDKLNEDMKVLTPFVANIKSYLYFAKRADFPELNEATDKIYELLKDALNVF